MFRKAIRTALGVLSALPLFPQRGNSADMPAVGAQRAPDLVSAIMGERIAMAAVNAPKAASQSTPTIAGLPVNSALLSRFEVIGGTDRLFFTPDVLKQAICAGEAAGFRSLRRTDRGKGARPDAQFDASRALVLLLRPI
jgi:hypothetical protein